MSLFGMNWQLCSSGTSIPRPWQLRTGASRRATNNRTGRPRGVVRQRAAARAARNEPTSGGAFGAAWKGGCDRRRSAGHARPATCSSMFARRGWIVHCHARTYGFTHVPRLPVCVSESVSASAFSNCSFHSSASPVAAPHTAKLLMNPSARAYSRLHGACVAGGTSRPRSPGDIGVSRPRDRSVTVFCVWNRNRNRNSYSYSYLCVWTVRRPTSVP